MSYSYDFGPGNVKAACAGCEDFPSDGTSPAGDQGGLQALKPNVAIIIIGLGFTLILVAAFAVFAKFMRPHFGRGDSGGASRLWEDVVKDGSSLDKNMIKTLPLVVFSPQSFLGLNLDSDCAVCLNKFEVNEELRLLPICKHMFHPSCIDSWLRSHPSCPLCRGAIFAPSWARRYPLATTAVNTLRIQPADETQPHLVPEETFAHHDVEIAVETMEARFEALRDSCCGRKSSTLQSPDSTRPSARKERMEVTKLQISRDELPRAGTQFRRTDPSEQPASTVCTTTMPEVRIEVVTMTVDDGKDDVGSESRIPKQEHEQEGTLLENVGVVFPSTG